MLRAFKYESYTRNIRLGFSEQNFGDKYEEFTKILQLIGVIKVFVFCYQISRFHLIFNIFWFIKESNLFKNTEGLPNNLFVYKTVYQLFTLLGFTLNLTPSSII